MAEQDWYWAQGEQQQGPVSAAVLVNLVKTQKIGGDHMVWRDGWAQWVTVRQVPGLVKYLANDLRPGTAPVMAATVPAEIEPLAVASQVQSVSYYAPGNSMPPRAMVALNKHVRPTGDVGDWPLDDVRVIQFDQALKLRNQINGATSLYRLLFLVLCIADVIIFILTVAAAGNARNVRGPDLTGFAVFAVLVGFSVLYYFTWKATRYCQRWAPMTMGILFALGGIANLVQMSQLISASSNSAPAMFACVGTLVAMVIPGAFAFVSFRAFAAIPGYLRQPAWCQELLAKTSA